MGEGRHIPVGFYVYCLGDPRDSGPFYIGKGRGARMYQHVVDWRKGRIDNAAKFARIGAIFAAGLKPIVECLVDDLTEDRAFMIEREIIRVLGIDTLTNAKPGQFAEAERLSVWAREMMRRIIPFDRWVATRHRSRDEIALYWFVEREIAECAR